MQGGYLIHEFLIYGESSGGIDDYDRIAFGFCLGDSVLRYFDWVLNPVFGIYRNLNSFAEDLQLLDGGRAERITGS